MERVIAYIDGFNLYFGLRTKGWKRFYWLNLQMLVSNLLKSDQTLLKTKYFTARVASPERKRKRQSIYLEALGTLPDFEIFYGKYQLNPRTCSGCGATERIHNEKMTDVNIAVEFLADAFLDAFDTAILISADSDLKMLLEKVKSLEPKKRIIVAFPPKRQSFELKNVADAYFTIGRSTLAKSLFPDEIVKPDGFVLHRPKRWK